MPEDWTDPFEDWFLEDPLGRLMLTRRMLKRNLQVKSRVVTVHG